MPQKDAPFPETTMDEVFGYLQANHPSLSDEEIAEAAQEMAAERYLRFITEDAQTDDQENERRSSE